MLSNKHKDIFSLSFIVLQLITSQQVTKKVRFFRTFFIAFCFNYLKVYSITPPPRHLPSLYKTTYCPGVTALCFS